MESRLKNINSFWGYLFIEELVRNRINCICISPGSRSTPLTIAAAENKRAEKVICMDERAAAFYALGYARATGRPAAVICTSGTAAANFYPAVVEAKKSHIPLILLTADRPPELRETGANQTINQVGMFHQFVKWQFDLPCPDTIISPKFLLSTVDHAIHQARNSPSGPVHLNCMFREPLEPRIQDFPSTYGESISVWEKSEGPFTKYISSRRCIDTSFLTEISGLINKYEKGLIVVGQLNQISDRQAVTEFAAHCAWPVFADITSGIRNQSNLKFLVSYFDQMLLSDKVMKKFKPEVILHFGRALTSKRSLKALEDLAAMHYIQIESEDERLDPSQLVSKRICAHIELTCNQLMTHVRPHPDSAIEKYLVQKNDDIGCIMDSYCSPEMEISEISLPQLIAQNLPREQALFLASSMPIRDFDMFAGSHIKTNNISSNRGASGIDGTLATAVGYGRGLEKRVTLLIGDLAMLHDLNSLSLVQSSRYPLTIVLVNNKGGGIFSFLPVSSFKNVFDHYFATAHHFQFKHVADMFNIAYEQPSTNSDFINLYNHSVHSEKSILIEINTDREKNFKLHQRVQKKILDTLEK
jgi:2-succinyl-5-enolpyruvyl-6-hydroxy-3-cyclohexene-1-carboxylate synthase